MWLSRKHKLRGQAIIFLVVLLFFVMSLPICGHLLVRSLEKYPALDYSVAKEAGAIAVIGCGVYYQSPEYGEDTLNGCALERIRYAAYSFNQVGTPIITIGGKPMYDHVPEAKLMKKVLEHDFLTPVTWVEDSSRDTYENAKNAHGQLSKQGIKRIYLITHAWHMRRAKRVFEKVGFEVIPAPIDFSTAGPFGLHWFLPSSSALNRSSMVMREWVGNLWYWVRY